MPDIRIIKRKDIDLNKWNHLIDKYSNGLPYAYSWYLDAVCENWKVIIYKDYEAGFSFQIKKKMGIPYSLHPFLTQQLGFFGKDKSIFDLFLKELEKNVFFYQYQLNHFNVVSKNLIQEKTNYELDLNKSYSDLYRQYKTNTKRNIKKAYNNNISISSNNILNSSDIKFVEKHSKIDLKGERLSIFNKLIDHANKNNCLEILQAKQNDQLISIIIFIKNEIRSVYLMAISNSEGLALKANFLLIDHFIKNNSKKAMILDFEGSGIEGIARFYAGFGAYQTQYPVIKNLSFKNSFTKFFQNL